MMQSEIQILTPKSVLLQFIRLEHGSAAISCRAGYMSTELYGQTPIIVRGALHKRLCVAF